MYTFTRSDRFMAGWMNGVWIFQHYILCYCTSLNNGACLSSITEMHLYYNNVQIAR